MFFVRYGLIVVFEKRWKDGGVIFVIFLGIDLSYIDVDV